MNKRAQSVPCKRLRGRFSRPPVIQMAALAACLSLGAWGQQQPGASDRGVPPPGSAPKQTQPMPPANNSGKAQAADPKRQMADDAARLLQMATELKAEVDKTNKDTLSLKVIRQAQSIEKLAKGVRQQLKQTGGPS